MSRFHNLMSSPWLPLALFSQCVVVAAINLATSDFDGRPNLLWFNGAMLGFSLAAMIFGLLLARARRIIDMQTALLDRQTRTIYEMGDALQSLGQLKANEVAEELQRSGEFVFDPSAQPRTTKH